MVTSPSDKLFRIPEPKLTKLCVYYIFGPVDFKELASLFNKNHGGRLSAKQITEAYGYMHDTKHESFERARDMNRTKREQLVNILRDELFYTDDRLREWIIQPSRPIAGLREPRRNEPKRATSRDLENSMTEDNTMVESSSDGY